MSTFSLSEDSNIQKKQKLMKLLPLIGLAALPALLFVYKVSEDTPYVFPLVLISLCVTIFIGIMLGIRRLTSIRLILENDKIVFQRPGRPEIRLNREDVKQIIEVPDSGLKIKSIDPTDEIFVTKDFQNYDQLKMELGSWLPIENQAQRKYPFYLIIAGLLLMVIFTIGTFVFRIRIFFYLWMASLASPVIYYIARDFKSMIVTKNRKKRIQSIISFVLIAYIIYKFLIPLFLK
jgi:fatty acid desaturase